MDAIRWMRVHWMTTICLAILCAAIVGGGAAAFKFDKEQAAKRDLVERTSYDCSGVEVEDMNKKLWECSLNWRWNAEACRYNFEQLYCEPIVSPE